MNFNNHREQNRKERGVKELNLMCASYDSKCSAVHAFNYNDLSLAQRRAFARREPSKNYLGVK